MPPAALLKLNVNCDHFYVTITQLRYRITLQPLNFHFLSSNLFGRTIFLVCNFTQKLLGHPQVLIICDEDTPPPL